MDRIQEYNHRKAYVELALANMLKAKRGFDFIKYVKAFRTEEEFIRIGDLRGCTVTFNVTASPLSSIPRLRPSICSSADWDRSSRSRSRCSRRWHRWNTDSR